MVYLPPVKLDRHILSNEAGPLAQFIKYGIVGVMATCVQMGIFYILAATCLKCLTADDWAVKLLGLPAVEVSNFARALNFGVATGIGFIIANVFCWLMNRWFVFRPGKFRWHIELAMFFGASTLATVIALSVMKLLIDQFGMMTTLAVFVEIVVSFMVNFFVRKFFIFKG